MKALASCPRSCCPELRLVPSLVQLAQGWAEKLEEPDGRTTIEDTVAECDTVVTRWMFRGTHRGEFAGIAPTGRRVEIAGINIDRIAGGRFVERWYEMDRLGLMRQLGAISDAPG